MIRVLLLSLLILLLPISIQESGASAGVGLARLRKTIEQVRLPALDEYKEALQSRGAQLGDQGVLIETVGAGQTLAEHNADVAFNPASVMKLATSLVALSRLGPDYRYRTNFLAGGKLDSHSRKLEGDLVVEGGADPMFALADAQEIANELSRLGVSRVTGALRIAGAFYYFATGYRSNLSRETSASKLRAALSRAGIKIDGPTVFGEKTGTLLLSHYSDQMTRILLFQNAHSSNAVAEVVGESVGGPQEIQTFLTRKLALTENELYVGRASGLEFNRLTPRASLRVLRALVSVLAKHSLKLEEVMPVAGVDSGTLRGRLGGADIRGAVVAKTGTLVSIDNGVSTLVGVAYTRTRGPVLFAVFNSGGGVHQYRRLQDHFVESFIAGEGGPAKVSRDEDALADLARQSIVQVFYDGRVEAKPIGSD
ncbi:MAG TPA: D-alanyl-D-alanine carboxypeptidase [Blastocatellia bacterium]|nr:D-alanyl-D-alanine carboxypeptidase [Blastocatellia bacterium]